jgi:hypothetical protein
MALVEDMRKPLIDIGAAVALVASLGLVFLVEKGTARPPARESGKGQAQREPDRTSGLERPPKMPVTLESRPASSPSPPSSAPSLLTPEPGPEPAPKAQPHFASVYVLRTVQKKDDVIGSLGGTLQSEQAVQAGLNWLIRHQAEDGSWSNACLGPKGEQPGSLCEEASPPCADPGKNYIVAQTGLALLALQAAGHYDFNGRPYSGRVRLGLHWLAAHQRPDGALVGPLSIRGRADAVSYRQYFMYEHAIASFALAEACAVRTATGEKPDETLDRSARLAIRFIEDHQHDDGGWRYTTNAREGSDSSVSGWAVLALKSAIEAGIPVSPATVARTREFFESLERDDGQTGYTRPVAGQDALTGVGVLVHLLLLKEKEEDSPLVQKAAPYLAGQSESYGEKIRAGQANYYTLYNATLALYQAGGPPWERWNHAIRDAVVADQRGGQDCNRGSWDLHATKGGPTGGRIYSTALGTLTLEVYYRYARKKD